MGTIFQINEKDLNFSKSGLNWNSCITKRQSWNFTQKVYSNMNRRDGAEVRILLSYANKKLPQIILPNCLFCFFNKFIS